MKQSSRSGGFFGRGFRLGASLVLLTGLSLTFQGSASSGGISVGKDASSGCRGCHTGTSYPTVDFFDVPSYVLINSSDYIYLRITSTSVTLTSSGFNAWVSSGSLSTSALTYGNGVQQINGDEVTHTAPKANTARFAFDFDAPSTTGTVTLYAWGNNVNGDGVGATPDSASIISVDIPVCKDSDGDGNLSGPTACPGTSDCDDNNASRYYGNTEICDGIDNDCDGSIDEFVRPTWYRDLDGDGYGNSASTTLSCSQPGGYVANSTDCDDNDDQRHPGNPEVCDNKDNDCDSTVDEGVRTTYYRDLDTDGFGNPSSTTSACSQPGGYVLNNTDCDDTCITCFPGGTEVCDGEDNNCTGGVDEPSAVDASTWYHDGDGDGFGDSTDAEVACSAPVDHVSNNTDCDDADDARYPGNAELCDNKDNDCSGATAIDAGCDDDNDNWCDASMTVVGSPTTCTNGWGDCADNDAARYPGNTELCDNKDNDCSGATAIDVGCDDDNDGYCDAAMTTVGTPTTCASGGGDCDDNCITCYPGNPELCDNKDNDCDTDVDEDISAVTCGFGICEQVASGCTGGVPDSCVPGPAGEEDCSNRGVDDDCDADANEIGHNGSGDPIYEDDPGCVSGSPGICSQGTFGCSGSSPTCTPIIAVGSQPEICDNLDNDCDGAVDEGCDDDNDGYCDVAMTVSGSPTTCLLGGGDCNDNPAASGAQINPGASESCLNLGVDNDCDGDDLELEDGIYGGQACASGAPGVCGPGTYTCSAGSLTCISTIAVGSQTEVCDGQDNNCDGSSDNGIPDLQCGVGACANTAPACDSGANNVCLPLSSSTEICDDIDNDCDSSTDEGCDDDGDNYCDTNMGISGTPAVCPNGGGDCDDADAVTYPTAGELCDEVDNDCDSDVDEEEDISLAECGLGICKRTGTTCEPQSCTPGLPETEVCDDLDNDCDGVVDNGCDDDGDGYCDADETVVGTPAICPLGSGDCNDEGALSFPGASEICDLEDNDCDGAADEVADLPLAVCGIGACQRTGTTCDPTSCTPGAPLVEVCDGIDNDCDSLPDEDLPLATCGEGACQTQGTSCLPSSCVPLEPEAEACDGVDNDCDGVIDNGCDDDKDGYCDFNLVYVSSPFCPLGEGDCDDLSADSYPGAPEICDGGDNDCNGTLDDNVVSSTCGLGACQAEGSSCAEGVAVDCTPLQPSDEVCDGEDNDCNGLIDDGIEVQSCGVGECLVVIPGCASGDAATCEPLAPSDEICDGLDNNCNSHIDDDAFCVGGLCVAGRCVTADELGLGGNSGFPDDYDEDDVERWLDGTAGAAMGGASSLDPNDYKRPRSVDRGSCAVHALRPSNSGPFAWLLLASGGLILFRRRKAG